MNHLCYSGDSINKVRNNELLIYNYTLRRKIVPLSKTSKDAGCESVKLVETRFLVARNGRCDVRLKLDPGGDQDWQDNTSLVSIRCTVISSSSLLDSGHGKASTMLRNIGCGYKRQRVQDWQPSSFVSVSYNCFDIFPFPLSWSESRA